MKGELVAGAGFPILSKALLATFRLDSTSTANSKEHQHDPAGHNVHEGLN
jgi:hypothetical protein